jgi:Tfp pilus assembly protein PilO
MRIDRLPKTILRYKFFWIACCLVLVANFAGYLLVIRNQRDNIDELHHKYIKIRKQSTQSVKKFEETTLQYLNVKKDLNTFTKMLPPVVTIADKARELATVIGKHNFTVNKMTFKPDKTSTLSLWKYTTSFKITGKYPELKVLLADIQNMPGLFCIENLVLNRIKEKELVDMTLRISTYFR